MANKGKKFEEIVQGAFPSYVFVLRLYDNTSGFKGINNPCDFLVYQYPYLLMLECKTKKGNTLNFNSDIRENQWEKMTELSKVCGVYGGVICWFYEKDVTRFYSIDYLNQQKELGRKSVKFDEGLLVTGKKKIVYTDYDMIKLLNEVFNNV